MIFGLRAACYPSPDLAAATRETGTVFPDQAGRRLEDFARRWCAG
ncbi:MAG: hypothetical protein QM661_12640 [Solimonas sp.]